MKKFACFSLCLMVLCLPVAGGATELGLTSYPDGIENFMAGAFPPPGMYYQNYWLFYTADRFPGGPPNPKAFLFAQVFRFIYSSKFEIFGANWGTHLVLPLVYTDLKSTFQGITVADDQRFGLANTAFDPIILGWHFGDFHVTAAFEIQFPGTYDRKHPASPSRNYFTFQPILGLAYLPSWGLGINIKLMYDFPTRNESPLLITGARDSYQSGQSFHFDYCVDYAVLPNLRIGAAGYYYTQTTSDYRDGVDIGFHGRGFAIGPGIKYDWQRWTFAFINQIELAAKNRPEGVRNWIRIWYAF